MKFDFNEQVVMVTGAGSGIGKTTAITFAQLGTQVYILDNNSSKLQEVSDE